MLIEISCKSKKLLRNCELFIYFRPEPLTFQAVSQEDMQLWLDAMDGKEPVSDERSFVLEDEMC